MLSDKEVREIIKGIRVNTLKHTYAEKSKAIAEEIQETFGNDYPKFLDKDRPKETEAAKNYRKSIFDNPVKGDLSRIIGKFSKIEQSEGFSQNFKLPKDGKNKLQEYTMNQFNGYNSILHWLFSTGVNAYINDPNSVVAVLDKNPPMLETEQYKPYPYIFSNQDVLGFKKGKYCLLKEETDIFGYDNYYLIDDRYYYVITDKAGVIEYLKVQHNCHVPPFFKIGQHIAEENTNGEQLFKSTISDALPHFKAGIRRSSDIEVEYNYHVSTKEWSISPRKCKPCQGSGRLKTTQEDKACDKCSGSGYESWNALGELYIDPKDDRFYGENGTFPFNSPGGFIARNIEAVKAMEDAYDRHIDRAYETIDFGTVLRERRGMRAESGDSKRYDRLEYSQKIYAEGLHLIDNVLMPVYRSIDSQIFGYDESGQRIPDVTIAIAYDIMSPETILAEIKTMDEAGISGRPKGELLLKYLKIVVGEEAVTTLSLLDEMHLNPFYGKSVEELELLFGGGEDSTTNAISLFNLTLSVNFKGFVDRALREHHEWFKLEEKQKYEILKKYTEELIEAKKAAQIANPAIQEREEEVTEEEEIENAA